MPEQGAPAPACERPRHPSENAAQARARALRTVGIWPAAFRCGSHWHLTYDPPVARAELNSHGYLLEP